MKTTKTIYKTLGLTLGIALSHSVLADNWFFSATPSLTEGSYKSSIQRSRLTERGIAVTGDYLDLGGLSAAYSKTWIGMKNSAPSTNQDNYLISGRLHFRPDALPGRLTARLDGHRLENDDATRNTSNVSVVAPQVSWLSNDSNLYIDLGYAKSRYQNNLHVNQYTPTIGFGLNGGSDWLQLRSYQIRGLNPARASGKSSTSSIDAKWTHYFAPQSALVPASLSLGISAGEKIYAVDMDAQSVANLADLNKGAATLGLSWNVAKNAKVFALVGQSRFNNVAQANYYKLNIGHASVSLDW